MMIDNKKITISGRIIKIARLEDEGFVFIENPDSLNQELIKKNINADLFSFIQCIPDTSPKYNYYMEWESLAVMPIKGFDYWWNKQISKETRKNIKKAKKNELVVKIVKFDDEFVRGIVDIYNESPFRQGKHFWHYGKDFDTVKKENATFLERSDFIGVYYNSELIGFIKLVYGSNCAHTMQVISKIKHRDKSPTNALLANAVEVCDKKGISFLQYGTWGQRGLSDFKRYNGFEKTDIPRYYIPLTIKGKIALKLGFHQDIMKLLPKKLVNILFDLRSKWYVKKII